MTALLTDNLPLLAGAPNGIKKLRELILELAVRGQLVEQNASDEPASELLRRIAEEKAQQVAEGTIKKQKPLPDIGEGEISFELPAGWAWQRFADFALDVSTGPFGSLIHQSDYVNDGVPLVNPSHMIDGRIVADHSVSLSIEMAEKLDSYRLTAGDMVMARRGEVGRVALVTEAEEGWLCGTGSFVLQFTPEVSREYVWTLFRCNSVRTYLAGAAVGMTMVNLNHGILLKMPIAVPPADEQSRIVAKLDELMALCDRLETRQTDAANAHTQLVQALLGSLTQASDTTEFAANWQRLAEHFHALFSTESSVDALKQTLLQLAVMGKLVPQDPADEPASEMLIRIQVEKLRLVAEGKLKKQKQLSAIDEDEKPYQLPPLWQWSRLGSQVIESGAGWSPSCEPRRRDGKEWGVLKVSAVSWGLYRPEENKALPAGLDPRPEHEVAEGDFLVSRANTAELVARSVVVENTPVNLMLSDKIVRLKLTSICDRRYVNFVNSSAFAREYYGRVAAGTSSSMKNVSREQILGLLIPLPPLAEQHRIVAKLDQLMALCDQLKTQLSQARQLNQQLATSLVEQAVT